MTSSYNFKQSQSNLICPVIPPVKRVSKERLPQLFSWSRRAHSIPILILSWIRGRVKIISMPSTFDSTKKKRVNFYLLWIFITLINSYLEPSYVHHWLIISWTLPSKKKIMDWRKSAKSNNCFCKSTQEWCR